MNQLLLVKQKEINNTILDFYKDENQEVIVTREQIGSALEYKDPMVAIAKIHIRNTDRFNQFSFTKLVNGRETYFYNFKGILEICRWSRQSKADVVIDKCWQVMEEINSKGFYIDTTHPNVFQALQQLIGIEKANEFEIINEASLQVQHGFGFHDPEYICQFEAEKEFKMPISRFMGHLRKLGLIEYDLDTYEGSRWKSKQKIIRPFPTQKAIDGELVQVAKNVHLRSITDSLYLSYCVRVKKNAV